MPPQNGPTQGPCCGTVYFPTVIEKRTVVSHLTGRPVKVKVRTSSPKSASYLKGHLSESFSFFRIPFSRHLSENFPFSDRCVAFGAGHLSANFTKIGAAPSAPATYLKISRKSAGAFGAGQLSESSTPSCKSFIDQLSDRPVKCETTVLV